VPTAAEGATREGSGSSAPDSGSPPPPTLEVGPSLLGGSRPASRGPAASPSRGGGPREGPASPDGSAASPGGMLGDLSLALSGGEGSPSDSHLKPLRFHSGLGVSKRDFAAARALVKRATEAMGSLLLSTPAENVVDASLALVSHGFAGDSVLRERGFT
jgi:hypothetical protein